jgi:hypothetical protein
MFMARKTIRVSKQHNSVTKYAGGLKGLVLTEDFQKYSDSLKSNFERRFTNKS